MNLVRRSVDNEQLHRLTASTNDWNHCNVLPFKIHKDTEATCTVTHALQNPILYPLIHTLYGVDKDPKVETPCI